jgi:hypothetical protein
MLLALQLNNLLSAVTPPTEYPDVAASRSIRLPAGGIWVIDPDVPAWCEVDWSGVIPSGATLSSVSYDIPDELTADDTAIDQDAGKWAIYLDGATHGVLFQIPLVATLSNEQTISFTAPLRCFNG